MYTVFYKASAQASASDSLLYICGHITEDYDQETESIQRYPVSPLVWGCANRLYIPGRLSSTAKKGL